MTKHLIKLSFIILVEKKRQYKNTQKKKKEKKTKQLNHKIDCNYIFKKQIKSIKFIFLT